MRLSTAARLGAALLACSAPTAAAPSGLQNEVFYHIFTRSMRDSNGDRDGDLKGIEQSLPYLERLGVTSILLTPLYPSPFYHNYFASDFDGIDPEYGSMDDYRRLVRAIHARGMKIYLDEEFQYVAYDHPWFKSALGNPGSPYSELFFFHGPGNTKPESGVFGITVAPRFPGAETGITTLNVKSPRFQAWAANYLMRWVDPNGDGDFSDGVDGFRIDHMMDDLDNKHILTGLFDEFWKPLFAKLKRANPKLNILAEQYDWGDGADFLRRGGVDAAFAFPLVGAIRSFDRAKIVAAIGKLEAAIPPGKSELVFVENHDMSRIASDPRMTPEKLRTAAALMTLLKGPPSIYYGQELGMRGTTRDEYKSDEREIGAREAFRWTAKVEAPGEATWYKGPKGYWAQRFAKDDDGVSVAEQDGDPNSLLNHYRRLLKLRATYPAFRNGAERVIPTSDNFLIVERSIGREKVLIVANLSDKSAEYLVSGRDLLSGKSVHGLHLRPFQTAVVRR
ncbi:MAG: alpha-amylase [Sphingomonadales bacterium]|nr:alpha-amylase [Sphingomonadales bacterium]